jgi:hypothetical protein
MLLGQATLETMATYVLDIIPTSSPSESASNVSGSLYKIRGNVPARNARSLHLAPLQPGHIFPFDFHFIALQEYVS